MSENLLIEEPDPPSGWLKDIQTNEIDVVPRAKYTRLAEFLINEVPSASEIAMLAAERQAIISLTHTANAMLANSIRSAPNEDSHILSNGVAILKRVTTKNGHTFFLNIEQGEAEPYCRSWSTDSNLVNWCLNEERHQPAEAVELLLREQFALPQEHEVSRARKIGDKVLGKLPRFMRTS